MTRTEIGTGELQHVRRQAEQPAILFHISQVRQGQQRPTHCGAWLADVPSHIAQRHGLRVRSERREYLQSAMERLGKVPAKWIRRARRRVLGLELRHRPAPLFSCLE